MRTLDSRIWDVMRILPSGLLSLHPVTGRVREGLPLNLCGHFKSG